MQRRNPTPETHIGLGATSRRASGDQDEAMVVRKAEGWRYLIRQLGECRMRSVGCEGSGGDVNFLMRNACLSPINRHDLDYILF